MDVKTVEAGKPVPFTVLLDAQVRLNEIAQALKDEARRVYEMSKTIPKGPPPPRTPQLHVEIQFLEGNVQANGVRHARFASGAPPRIVVEVEGSARTTI